MSSVFSGRSTTGRPDPLGAVQSDPAQGQADLLRQLLGQTPDLGQGLEQILSQGQNLLGTTPEQRQQTNLSFAKTQADRQQDQLQRALTTSQVERGQGNAGFSQTQQNAASAAARAATFDQAFQRSFGESVASQQLGGQLIQQLTSQQQGFAGLLTDLISRLLVGGQAADAQSFAARVGGQTSKDVAGISGISL